jgi:hypothetical protein
LRTEYLYTGQLQRNSAANEAFGEVDDRVGSVKRLIGQSTTYYVLLVTYVVKTWSSDNTEYDS